jgi:hypothetical protein
MGQSGALGALHLTRQAITPAERERLVRAAAQRAQRSNELERFLVNVADADPALAASVDAPGRATVEAVAVAVAAAMALVPRQLIDAPGPDGAALDHVDTITAQIDAVFRLNDAAFAGLGTQLDARLAAAQRQLAGVMLAVLVAGGRAGALMLSVARGTVRTAASAQAAAEALARGDLSHSVQVQVQVQDEIGHMAHTLGGSMRQLARLVREIKATGESVGTASAAMAAGNNALSARTEQTSANLQNAASVMHSCMPCAPQRRVGPPGRRRRRRPGGTGGRHDAGHQPAVGQGRRHHATASPSRPTSWRCMRPWRPPRPASRAAALPWRPARCGPWPSAARPPHARPSP